MIIIPALGQARRVIYMYAMRKAGLQDKRRIKNVQEESSATQYMV